jgi:hypothetical protein
VNGKYAAGSKDKSTEHHGVLGTLTTPQPFTAVSQSLARHTGFEFF